MKFRPCIDLHHGQVKQIVGSTLSDTDQGTVKTNFETSKPSREFAELYKKDNLLGGHVILLGQSSENTKAAQEALEAWPRHLQVGGGINDTNAKEWIDKGASHIIVTSYVFRQGQIDYERLDKLVDLVGKNQIVLDLSCRRKPEAPEGPYYVVTDRWQTFTDCAVTPELLVQLASYCDEFLVHGVEVEGKQCGILEDLVELLGKYSPIPVTYAGGVRSIEDLELVDRLGKGRVDCTVGSALDIFGGTLPYQQVVQWHNDKHSSQ